MIIKLLTSYPLKIGIINMKYFIYRIALIGCLIYANAFYIGAEENGATRSRRSSICSILVKHDDQRFADEIERQFLLIPVSDRFNDHNLSVRVVNAGNDFIDGASMDAFVNNNLIASRLIGRWFDRNILTGACTTDTIRERGLYDASSIELELSRHLVRGSALLEDAGEELIGNTFLLLNEVNYVDKSKRSALWASIGGFAMGALMAAGGANSSDIANTMQNTAAIINSYKGFAVKIRTRLYRLAWDCEIADCFYSECYATEPGDDLKRAAFEKMRSDFRLEFVGEVVSNGARTSFLGIGEEHPELMVRKACARAIDQNIADLQHRFEPFRIKTPITSVEPVIKAPIGKKEGVTATSNFEVLEVREKSGRTEYHRVGTVRPVETQIWDNRFMAETEGGADSAFGATTFITTSGNKVNFYPGMLLREID